MSAVTDRLSADDIEALARIIYTAHQRMAREDAEARAEDETERPAAPPGTRRRRATTPGSDPASSTTASSTKSSGQPHRATRKSRVGAR